MIPEESGIQDPRLPDGLAVELDAFVFFHLGSDADVSLGAGKGAICVSIRHRRVFPIQFELNPRMIDDFSRHPDRFEEFLLNILTRHRRDA